MPLVQTRGAASAQGFGEFAQASAPVYIEDVFSTYLYTGTGATQTITNGIDLAGKGGLVWSKDRVNAYDHYLFDTVRGLPTSNQALSSNTTGATGYSDLVQSFTSSGFTGTAGNNRSNVAWTFRKQPKFFDIVTWSGNDASNRQIAHNLGSVPGCIIARAYTSANDWSVYHRSIGATKGLYLNLTQAEETNTQWGNTTPTSSVFTTNLNGAGNTYIAYLFAHDAGGFGLAGTDNVISCGGYTGTGAAQTINLGYEPQLIITKRTNTTGDWQIIDNIRGFSDNLNLADKVLNPNLADAETDQYSAAPGATGIKLLDGDLRFNASGSTYIYIAIRRGPMKVPTLGTSVYNADTRGSATATANNTSYYSGFPVDLSIGRNINYAGGDTQVFDRLRGDPTLWTNLTNAESAVAYYFDSNKGFWGTTQSANTDQLYWMFRRAPSFFDVVCYTGTGSATTVAHNLGVVPELVIIKNRTSAYSWQVGALSRTFAKVLSLDQDSAEGSYSNVFNNTDPTASVFSVGTGATTNGNTNALVAYLFATCAGVSKVGSYTGTGTTQTINCGFTAGSRFVLIKRTDSTGNWYVWDSARGIIAGNDPYLLLNSTAAQVTNTDYVDTAATGFEISSTAPAAINANGGSFIFLAIA